MASNLSTIGFVFPDEETFRTRMMTCAAETGARLPCTSGEYGVWQSRTGAQVWFHMARNEAGETEIYGLTPFFEGKSEIPLHLTSAIHREADNPFEGALHGWVNPDGNGSGAYPVVFDCIDIARLDASALPSVRPVRLVAFARQLTAFSDEAAFNDAHAGGDAPHLAGKAFIPIGMFDADQQGKVSGAAPVPHSTALLTGKVVEYNRLTNEVTNQDYDWMLVETLDATLDVIADPAIVRGSPREGSIVEVSALLFGRVLDS